VPETAQPERSDRVKAFIAVRAGHYLRKHTLMFDATGALRALEDIADPFQGLISCTGSAKKAEMEPYKMLSCIAEERLNTPIVFYRFADDKPEQDPEPHFTVIFSIHRLCKIPPPACFQMSPT
jgi:hypothetical protein